MKRFFVLLVIFPFVLLFPPHHRAIPHPRISTDSVYAAWIARYNGPGNDLDQATGVAIDSSGNLYVTGLSGGDCATVKYSPSGQELWSVLYDGTGSSGDWANTLALDDSGNAYIVGYTSGSGPGSDYLTIKYDGSGQEEWVARYNGPGDYYDEANGVGIDDLGNVYVAGYSIASGSGGDYATVKYDVLGQEQWDARYNGPGDSYDEAVDLAFDASGNVYVTGYSPGSGTGSDYATIKYDTSGQEQWVARYDGPGSDHDYAFDLAVDGSGNVFVTGLSGGDYATIKYDSSGQEQWVARYDGGSFDQATALAVDASGSVIVTGYSTRLGGSEDYATIRYDSTGQEQWVALYDGPAASADQASHLVIDGSGNIYVTGYSSGSGTDNDYATIKYDDSGEVQWIARYDAEGLDDRGTAVALDASGVLHVTGLSLTSATGYDFATIKYQEIQTTVGSEGGEVPGEFSLDQNYPNPFNPTTTFEFSIPHSLYANLSVYNLLGEKVATVVDEQLPAGTHQVSWDATGQPSGMYFYRLVTTDFVQTKKLVLLR